MGELDLTLADNIKEGIEMNIYPFIAEGEAKERYPSLDTGQFADAANRYFPVDTAAHCKAAMVYLNKYYNNPSEGGITADYSKDKFKSVHNKIVSAMKKFGIEHDGCSICNKKESAKGGLENMSNEPDERLEESEDVETAEASEEEVEETLETDVEPDAEVKASDEEEEEVVEASEEIEEETVEETQAEELTVADKVKNLVALINEVAATFETNETEASEDSTAALEDELAKAKQTIEEYQSKERGQVRLSELSKAGIKFPEDNREEKIIRYGKMSDEEFKAHAADLASVAKAEQTTKAKSKKAEATGLETPPQFLPNVEDPEFKSLTEQYVEMYKKDK